MEKIQKILKIPREIVFDEESGSYFIIPVPKDKHIKILLKNKNKSFGVLNGIKKEDTDKYELIQY